MSMNPPDVILTEHVTEIPTRVLIKFKDGIEFPYVDGVEESIKERFPEIWDKISATFPNITLVRKFTTLSADQIRDLVKTASETDPDYEPPDFLTFFVIDIAKEIDPNEVAKFFAELEIADYAYVESPPTPSPAINAADDGLSANQGYLDAAPVGIGARFAWTLNGGDGNGVQFVDLERGWNLNHEDLLAATVGQAPGLLNQDEFYHGTRTLGVVLAQDNKVGCVGIAPAAKSTISSIWRTPTTWNIADGLMAALPQLGLGEVLLAETQIILNGKQFLPIELEPANFETIRLATALGVTIIEPAGNGTFNLNLEPDALGNQILNRGGAQFRDSGAVMVAAATRVTRQRLQGGINTFFSAQSSNFGNRVNCFAWGEQVTTTDTDALGTANTLYTNGFDGTSSASAIISGAAVALQGIAKATPLGVRTPGQLRNLLANPTTGTLSANSTTTNPNADNIGVMPNLQNIVQLTFNVGPDLFLRDFVGDTGISHNGPISSSPDVILRQSQVNNPQTAFGSGSGTENSYSVSQPAKSNQNNYLYVRMLNRGGSNASNVEATVYWSPVATLVRPDLWRLIGSTILSSVPNNNMLIVSNAILWPATAIPAPGHYCFVAVLNHAQDPAPILPIGPGGGAVQPGFQNFANYQHYIRRNNNVTWRNFNVVSNLPQPGNRMLRLPFLLTGAFEEEVEMRVQVVSNLPVAAKLWWEGAAEYLLPMVENRYRWKPTKKAEKIRIRFNTEQSNGLWAQRFPAGLTLPCQLRVSLPEQLHQNDYEVSIQQFFQEEEVGRITWLISASKLDNL